MIKLTIDNKPIEVSEGTTVLGAARSAGINIPTLCDHPELSPYGGCRLCLVEVEGARTLQPSCTLPVSNGMVVRTDTEKTKAARKFVLTLIFSERNHFCPYCQVSGGDCELQNAAYAEGMTHWPLQPNWIPYPMDASHPYIILENNRCILCRRCVRACGELVGNFTLGFEERGARSILVADIGVPLGTSSCIGCGTCVQVCPTGALIDRWSAYKGRETQVERTHTICNGCSVGCGLDVLSRDNNLVRIEGNWEAPVNEGLICKVGRFYSMDEKRDRILTPMIRKDGSLKAATWEDAFHYIKSGMKDQDPKEVSAIASSKITVEALHNFSQLFKGLKIEASTFDGSSTTAASSSAALKTGKSFEGGLQDIKDADTIVVIGTDLVKEHEVIGFLVKRQIPQNSKVLLVDTPSNLLAPWVHDVLTEEKGISVDTIKKIETHDLVKEAKKVVMIYGERVKEEALSALIKTAQKLDAKLIGVRGQANSLAAAIFELDKEYTASGKKAAFLILGDENPSQHLIKQMDPVPFLVVQASYASAMTAKASVVLPSADWKEEEGHFVNFEGKLQKSQKALDANEMVRNNDLILAGLAAEFGVKLSSDWKKALSGKVSPVSLDI